DRALPETINLIHYLAAGLPAQPITLLCLAREPLYELHPNFGEGDFAVQRIELQPLSNGESRELLQTLVRGAGAPDQLTEHVEDKLDGSPRAIVDFVRLMLEAGVLRARDGPGRALVLHAKALRAFVKRLPGSHEEILAERLRIMPAPERDLLEKAAACGEVFWLDAVVALVRAAALERGDPDGPTLGEIAQAGDRSRVAAAETLGQLVDRGFIVEPQEAQIPGEREWRFAYQPIPDLIYGGIAEGPRMRYHRLIAQWMELRPEGRNEEEQEEVGRHLERAGDGEGAATRYRRAADAA